MFKKIKVLICGVAIVLAGYATAQATPGVWGITGGTDYNDGANDVLGWSFTPKQEMYITGLGVYAETDFTSGLRGFTQDHQVGLYNENRSLLASTTVTNADNLNGMFRFHNLDTAIALSAGATYYLAAAMGADQFIFDPTQFLVNSQVTFGKFAYSVSDSLVFPGTPDPGVLGYFGPNFEATAAVPEPSTLLLVGAGLGSVVLLRRRARSVESTLDKEILR